MRVWSGGAEETVYLSDAGEETVETGSRPTAGVTSGAEWHWWRRVERGRRGGGIGVLGGKFIIGEMDVERSLQWRVEEEGEVK